MIGLHSRIGGSEYHHFICHHGEARQFIHGAAERSIHQVSIDHSACVHTGAEKHLAIANDHTPQHALHVVIAVRRLLAFGRRDNGIRHQKDRDIGRRNILQQCMSIAQCVLAAFSTIGRVIQYKECLHYQERLHSEHASHLRFFHFGGIEPLT